MSVKSYTDWKKNPDSDFFMDEEIKYVYSYEEIGAALVENADSVLRAAAQVKNYAERAKRLQDTQQTKMKKGLEAGKRAESFKERAAKTENPESKKINVSRANEESMRQKIIAAELKVLQMKQTLTQSQMKTAEMKKAKAEKS